MKDLRTVSFLRLRRPNRCSITQTPSMCCTSTQRAFSSGMDCTDLVIFTKFRPEPALRVADEWKAHSERSEVFRSPPLNGKDNPNNFDIVLFELWSFV